MIYIKYNKIKKNYHLQAKTNKGYMPSPVL